MQVIIPSVFFLNKEPPVYVRSCHVPFISQIIQSAAINHAWTWIKLSTVVSAQVWDLQLNDPDCRGVEVGNDYVFSIKTNLTDCGTAMVILISVVKALCIIIKPLQTIPGTGERPQIDVRTIKPLKKVVNTCCIKTNYKLGLCWAVKPKNTNSKFPYFTIPSLAERWPCALFIE